MADREHGWEPFPVPAEGFYDGWVEQLAVAEQNDGIDHRIGVILYLAKAIHDSAEKTGQEANDAAGGPSHAYGLYKIPEHHMIRLGMMLSVGTTE